MSAQQPLPNCDGDYECANDAPPPPYQTCTSDRIILIEKVDLESGDTDFRGEDARSTVYLVLSLMFPIGLIVVLVYGFNIDFTCA